MTFISNGRGFVYSFTPLNPEVVAITRYPLKGARGWPQSTSVTTERARAFARKLQSSEQVLAPAHRGLLG